MQTSTSKLGAELTGLVFDVVRPEKIMRKDELRLAKQLLRDQAKFREDQPSDIFELNRQKTFKSLESLCSAVLEREIGIQRYMVIRATRSDGYQKTLQVMSFSLIEDFGLRRCLAWAIFGRSLRKDGTIGVRHDCFMFDDINVERRVLDGTWIQLTKRSAQVESSSK